MRIGEYTTNGANEGWCGVSRKNTVINLSEAGDAAGIDLPERTAHLFDSPKWKKKAELVVEYAEETGVGTYSADDVGTLAPISDPQKIVCVGLNYREHAEEGDNLIPDTPVLFSKFPTAITGHESAIEWDPTLAVEVDYEAELVAVIGSEARHVSRANAMNYVAGYSVGNDVSARSLQHGDGQWIRGKSLDTFAPIGPEIVTRDEITDPHDLDIWAEVNGERLQDSTTSDLIFGIDELVSFCSHAFTLHPGDLLFTGTPPGVGVYRDPQVLLEEGDTVAIGIEGLGKLVNECSYVPSLNRDSKPSTVSGAD